jgi:hypothetical protein
MVHQQIIGGYTGLTGVDGFAPGYSSSGKTDVCVLVHNTGTLAS